MPRDKATPFVRRADSRQRLRHRGRGRVQAGGRAPRRARVALERYPVDRAKMQAPVKTVAQAAQRAGRCDLHSGWRRRRAVGCADADCQRHRYQARAAARHRLVGRPADLLESSARWRAGMRARTRPAFAISPAATVPAMGRIPVRTASLAYDAVALVAALVKTQGQQRFSEQVLTNSLRLHRHRRAVPLPARRHQPARARGDEGVAGRRPDHQPAAEGFRRGELTYAAG